MGRVYASSDWHGSKVGFKVLEYLQPDDTLYFLGDSSDRGKYGFELMSALLKDKRVKYIKGNHDQFFIDNVAPMIQDVFYESEEDLSLWMMNGGSPTYESVIKADIRDLTLIYYQLKKAPTELQYISPKGHTVILEHAGYTPTSGEKLYTWPHDPLWDRDHFNDEWDPEYADTYLVHGHTTVPSLKYDYGYIDQPKFTEKEKALVKYWGTEVDDTDYKILRYCYGHKFDIDLCSVFTNKTVLLDLDTFEEIYFYDNTK